MRIAKIVGLVLLYVFLGCLALAGGATIGSYIDPPRATQGIGDRP